MSTDLNSEETKDQHNHHKKHPSNALYQYMHYQGKNRGVKDLAVHKVIQTGPRMDEG